MRRIHLYGLAIKTTSSALNTSFWKNVVCFGLKLIGQVKNTDSIKLFITYKYNENRTSITWQEVYTKQFRDILQNEIKLKQRAMQ